MTKYYSIIIQFINTANIFLKLKKLITINLEIVLIINTPLATL